MAETWLYRLRPHSPFHFGDSGLGPESGDETFHSDSLFGALATAVNMWHGESALADLLSRVDGKQSFRLSSLFPYAGDVLLFPKPLLDVPRPREPAQARGVSTKNVRFISPAILKALLQGKPADAHLSSEHMCQGGAVWVTESERQAMPTTVKEHALWHRFAAPKTSVDRIVPASSPHYLEQLVFNHDCGLFFLLEVEDAATRELIENALHFLSDAGLGGHRSAGYGKFSVESASRYDRFWASDGELLMTLSLYHPTPEELEAGVLGEGAAYELTPRSSWAASPERRGQRCKSSFFINEGSVIRSLGKSSYGSLVDVTPEVEPEKHPVYRYGFAFVLGIQTEGH